MPNRGSLLNAYILVALANKYYSFFQWEQMTGKMNKDGLFRAFKYLYL